MGSAATFAMDGSSARPFTMQQGAADDTAVRVQCRPLLSARGTRLQTKGQGAGDVYSYKHLKAADYDTVVALLHGDVTLEALPTVRPTVIRVFVSSAHADMETERNILAEEVFPQLRQYCRTKHGVEFHAVDMCWGVSAQGKADYPKTELCLAELSHCQATSTGPNFLVLLGQRPDRFPLPAVVAKTHFEILRAHLVNKGCDVTLVDSCYRQDENVEPNVYRLLDRDQLTEQTGLDWAAIETRLRNLIENGVTMAVSDLSPEGKLQIFGSEMEREIHQGLIAYKGTSKNCILVVNEDVGKGDGHSYTRQSDVRSCVISAVAEECAISREETWSSLAAVAQERVPTFNCIRSSGEQEPEPSQADRGRERSRRLSADLYRTLTALVDGSLQEREPLLRDELFREVVTHWTTVAEDCRNFVGREAALSKVRQYLTEENTRPYLVQGPPGSGRSALMAQIAARIRPWTCGPAAANPLTTSLVVRFVGASPRMTSVHELLRSICHQIAFIAGQPRRAVPDDYRSLKQHFVKVVQRGELPGLLVVLVDGLELLTPSNGAHGLSWLPATISGNVKIIVSAGTEPAPPSLTERLVSKAGLGNALRLEPLTVPEAERAVRAMLDTGGRRVTSGQWGRLQDAVRHCTSPLFLLLLVQEASRWRSYDVFPGEELPNTIETLFHNFLDHLEATHDKTLVRRSLAYLTAARWGLSEGELLDVLSLDDDVLRAVATRGRPPLPRVPPALWSALYLDLQPLLVVRESDQWPVLWWRHETFGRLARGRYLGDVGHFTQVHRILCDYYLGTWSAGAAKPLAATSAALSSQAADEGRVTAAVRRHVPDMPLSFSGCGGRERFNLRKMTQLPFSLRNSGQHDRLRSLCLCNYEWLHARLRATSLELVLEDFADFHDRQAALVADALRMGGSVLSEDPDRLAADLSGRLLPHIGRFPAVRELLRQCDLAAQAVCPLVPLVQLYPAPGAPLRYQRDLGVRSAGDVTVFSCQEEILMTAPSHDYAGHKVWELTQDEPRLDVRLPPGAVYPSQDGRYLALLGNGLLLRLYRTDSGLQHGDGVDLACEGVSCVATGKRYLAVCPDRGVGPVLVDMEEARPAQRFGFHAQVCALSSDEGRLAFSNGCRVLLYEFPLLDRQLVGQVCDVAQQLALTRHYTKCLVLTKTGMLQSIFFDLVARNHTTSDIVYDLEMRDFILSHSENLVLCRAARRLYVISVQARHDKLLHRLQTPPDKVGVTDALSTFSGVGFSQDDRLVLASRYVHLFVWDCASGTLVRMLQVGLSLVARLFRPAGARNCAVTLLEDGTLQVWDLNNVDADVRHTNTIINGSVESVGVSSVAGLVACQGKVQGQAEVKLVELRTGRIVGSIPAAQQGEAISSLTLGSGGRYLMTQSNQTPPGDERCNSDYSTTKHLLRHIQLWTTERGKLLISKINCRYGIFDQSGSYLGIIHCNFYNQLNPLEISYSFSHWSLDALMSGSQEEETFNLPNHTEFVTIPFLFCDACNVPALVCVLQEYTKTFEEHPGFLQSQCINTFIFIQRLSEICSGSEPNPQRLYLEELLQCAENDSLIANVKLSSANLLLVTYIRQATRFEFDVFKGLVVLQGQEKGIILYDLLTENTMKHISTDLSPCFDLDLRLSSSAAIGINKHLQVFDVKQCKLVCQLNTDLQVSSVCFALDDRYLVGLTVDGHFIEIFRTSDGTPKGTLLVHGQATSLEVAEDGRTIAVGTADGRVMLMNLVLELSDPYVELVRHIPSRSPPPQLGLSVDTGGGLLVANDALTIQGNSAELQRLSAKIRSNIKLTEQKLPSFHKISVGMVLTQQARSQACCIQ